MLHLKIATLFLALLAACVAPSLRPSSAPVTRSYGLPLPHTLGLQAYEKKL